MRFFPLHLHEGHPIIESGDDVILVDTGAPTTIHVRPELDFCSSLHHTATEYMGLNTDRLSEMLGKRITTLLGADILSNHVVFFDYPNGQIGFGRLRPEMPARERNLKNFMGIPIVPLTVGGNTLSMFLDTGAKLSYLSRARTMGLKSVGNEEDFYPTLGKFKTPIYELTAQWEGHDFEVRFGKLPPLLEMTLTMGNASGIIGYDFFSRFRVWLDLRKGKMGYV
jgi:hypothetical protein